MTSPLRLARRFKQAAYFSVGDVILYGKYKNKKGIIKEFGHDPKGNPTILIEPTPKGRKQDKLMGLFKIWKAPMDKQVETPMRPTTASKRVAARFIQADGFPLGRTFDFDTFRVHRYRGLYQITDLTNAGKRGKKVKVMAVTVGGGSAQREEEVLDEIGKNFPNFTDYEHVKGYLRSLKEDDPYVNWSEREVRGIDVNPGGTTEIRLKTNGNLQITSNPLEFSVTSTHKFEGVGENKDKSFNQDTLYYSRDKEGARIFYNWLKANLSEANKMDITALRSMWNQLGVKYDYH